MYVSNYDGIQSDSPISTNSNATNAANAEYTNAEYTNANATNVTYTKYADAKFSSIADFRTGKNGNYGNQRQKKNI